MEIYSRDLMPFGEYLSLARKQTTNSAMQALLSGIMASELSRISQSIDALRAEFNWALGEVLLRLDMQEKSLEAILDRIQAPLDTQAKELRKRAQYAYNQGWFDDALSDFLESEKKNYQDFVIYQAVANIYLYHRQPPELGKAREYYLKLSKYATPVSSKVSALAYMYAGFVCYLQKDDDAAIRYAAQAAQIAPELTEAFYNHAKFSAAAGRTEEAIPSLETAIRRDRNYLDKAGNDSDFTKIRSAVSALIEKLRDEARSQTLSTLAVAESKIERHTFVDKGIEAKAHALLAKAREQIKADTYSSCLDAIVTISTAAGLTEDKLVTIRGQSVGDQFLEIRLDGKTVHKNVFRAGHRLSTHLQPGHHVLWMRPFRIGNKGCCTFAFDLEQDSTFEWYFDLPTSDSECATLFIKRA